MNTTRLFAIALVVAASVGATAQTMYVIDSSRAISTVNLGTGAKTPTGISAGANAGTTGGLAYDPVSDTVWVTSSSNDALYTLDLATGTAALVGAFGDTAVVMHGIEWDGSTGTLYGMSSHNAGLYTLNTGSGLATLVGTTGLTSFCNLGLNTSTNTMFMTNSGTDSAYTINRANGVVALLGPLGAGSTNPDAVAYSPNDNRIYYADNSTDNLYWIDQGSGAANLVGSMGTGNILGMAWVGPVPEPTTIVALGLGSALLLLRRPSK